MDSIKKTARLAGLLYVLLGIPAYFSLMYLPKKLIVSGNAAATAARIRGSEALFRLGIVGGLVSMVGFLFLALVLFRLFEEVNRKQAFLLLIFVLVQVPIAFLNEVSSLGALKLLGNADFLSVFGAPQREALAMLFLNLHSQGIFVSEIFWGLWLFPFGVLVCQSGFIPRALGIWLLINGGAYVALSFTALLSPQAYTAAFRAAFPLLLGELAIQLWLLIVGARLRPPVAQAS
jgi:hypothetical protein